MSGNTKVLLGLGLGLGAGLAGAIGLEFINDTIKSREDVRRKLGLPCIGAVPRIPAKDAFVEELKAWWRAIVEGAPVENPVEDARRDMELLVAFAKKAIG